MLDRGRCRAEGDKGEGKKWEKGSSVINKIYLKKDKELVWDVTVFLPTSPTCISVNGSSIKPTVGKTFGSQLRARLKVSQDAPDLKQDLT